MEMGEGGAFEPASVIRESPYPTVFVKKCVTDGKVPSSWFGSVQPVWVGFEPVRTSGHRTQGLLNAGKTIPLTTLPARLGPCSQYLPGLGVDDSRVAPPLTTPPVPLWGSLVGGSTPDHAPAPYWCSKGTFAFPVPLRVQPWVSQSTLECEVPSAGFGS